MKQMRFRENLKKAMAEKGISISELARQIGKSQPGLSKILNGKTADPSASIVGNIANALGIDVETLMYGDDPVLEKMELPRNARKVPMLNWVQAGNFTEIDPHEVEAWYLCPNSIGKDGFCLTVRGESMEPDFHEGDVVFVDPEREWHSGSIVIVVDDDGGDSSATMKKLMEDESGRPYLRPLNPAWPEQFIKFTPSMRVVGSVIGKYTDVAV